MATARLTAGDLLPSIEVPPPGPRSRELAALLGAHESPNVTFVSDDFPIFWREALGANVLDVDGNIYIDLTAAFGVAATGHRNPRVSDAIHAQLDTLVHGMGDVHPPEIKARLLERLAEIAPGDLSQTVLASSGAEAVEASLKTARLASGRPGVLCFGGAYHGLTYGALSVTAGEAFRGPFEDQLGIPALRAPYPDSRRGVSADDSLAAADDLLNSRNDIGAVIVEPILGRDGFVIPPTGFLAGLREICDRRELVFIFDEVYTGFGRTGRWFACQHEDVVPDIMCVGKALTGALPFSACIGRPGIMAAWPPSRGEAIHTSTFLGHPLGCAAALAQIDEIESRRLVARSARLGSELIGRLRRLAVESDVVGEVRGRGLMAAFDVVAPGTGEPDPALAGHLLHDALRRGLIILTEGASITFTPPLTIGADQLDYAVGVLRDCLPRA
jgi:4-aminobutyrate aminotransferase-like enzyme